MMGLILLALLPFLQQSEVDALLQHLTDGTIEEREKAIKALVELGDKAEAGLKARMAKAEEPVRKVLGQILEQIAIPKNLRGVLPPIARVNIDARDRSLRDVLEDFQNQTRIPLKLGRASQSAQWPNVTVRIDNASPLEALNSICRAAKYYWYVPDRNWDRVVFDEPGENKPDLLEGPELHFGSGDYDKPRLFIRHYELEIWEIVLTRTNDFKKGRTRGELSIGLFWPAGVKPHAVEFEVSAAVDELGNELLEGHDDPSYAKGPRKEVFWSGGAGRFFHRYRLKVPEKGARTLKTVRGRARLFYLLKTRTVTFEAPEKAVGSRKETGGIGAHLVDFKSEASQIVARVRIEGGAAGDSVGFFVHTEGGKKSGPFAGSRRPDTPLEPYTFSSYIPSKVVALEVVVDTECAEDTVDFEFKDVPLP
jgi:hypothetical protein